VDNHVIIFNLAASLTISQCVGKMSTGDGYGHC